MPTNSLVFQFIAQDQASKVFQKVGRQADSFSTKMKQFAKRAAFAATLAGGVFAAKGVQGFLEFNDAMTQSLAIMGDISGPMRKKMKAAAIEVSQTLQFSAAQAAEGFFFLASSGFDVNESLKAMPIVAEFAQAGMVDMATATELVVDAQKALGLNSDNTAENLKNLQRVTDVMTETNIISNATIEQVAESLTNKAGPAMRVVGMEIEEGAAALAAMASQGLKGKKAGLSLSIVLRELTRRAITHTEAFEEANIAVFDQSGELRNLGVIIGEMEEHFADMSDEQKRASLMMLGFTDRSIQVILNMLGTSDAIMQYEEALRKAGGRTKEVAENQMESFVGKLSVIKGHVEEVAMAVGETLVNAVFDVGEKLAPLGKEVADVLNTEVKPVIAKAWDDISSILFGEDIAVGQGGGGEALTRRTQGLIDQAEAMAAEFVDALVGAFSGESMKPVGESIGKAIGKALNKAGDLAGKFIEWVKDVDWVAVGITAGKKIIPFAIGLLTGFINGLDPTTLIPQLAKHWQEILLAAVALAFAPAKLVKAIANALRKIPFVGKFLAWLLEGFEKLSKMIVRPVINFLGRMFGAFANGLTGGLAGRAFGAFVRWLKNFPKMIKNAGTIVAVRALELMEGLGKAILSFAGNVGKWIGKVIGWITLPFRKAGGWLFKRGLQLIKGLIRGILTVAKSIGGWIKRNVIDRVIGAFKTAIKWLFPKGKATLKGFIDGMFRIANTINRWIKRNVFDPVVGFFKNAISWLFNAGKRTIRGLLRGIADIFKSIGSWLRRKVKNPITDFFGNAINWLISAGKDLIKGLKDGMLDFLSSPIDFFKSVGRKIISGVKDFFGIGSPSKVFAGFGGDLVTGLIQGMITSARNLPSLVGKIFGSMPKALAHLVTSGVVALSKLPAKAFDALSGIGGFFADLFGFGDSSGKMGRSAQGRGFAFPLPRGTFRVGQGLGAGRGHQGQDFPVPMGTPVFAPFSGIAVQRNAGNRSYGRYVDLRSGPWRFLAAHLSAFGLPGFVRAGQLIGFSGSSGRSTGPHLHAEFRLNGQVISPSKLLSFAKGGFGRMGDLAMVGEEGPELVKFKRPGRVMSNDDSQEFLDTQRPITIENFNMNAVGGQFSVRQVRQELRYRGLL